MDTKSQLIVADAKILPEVFTKVLEVKKLMAQKGLYYTMYREQERIRPRNP